MKSNQNPIPRLKEIAADHFESRSKHYIPDPKHMAGTAEYWNISLEDLNEAIRLNVDCWIDKMPGYYGPEKFHGSILFQPVKDGFGLLNFYLTGELKRLYLYRFDNTGKCKWFDLTGDNKDMNLQKLGLEF